MASRQRSTAKMREGSSFRPNSGIVFLPPTSDELPYHSCLVWRYPSLLQFPLPFFFFFSSPPPPPPPPPLLSLSLCTSISLSIPLSLPVLYLYLSHIYIYIFPLIPPSFSPSIKCRGTSRRRRS